MQLAKNLKNLKNLNVRTHQKEFAAKYLCHDDDEVRFYAVRALWAVKPPMTPAELKEHDGGESFAQLQILQSKESEGEGLLGMRMRNLAQQLVEVVLAADLKPGVGEGYKAHLREVKEGPGVYAEPDANAPPAADDSDVAMPFLARREAAQAQAASRDSARRKRVESTEPGTEPGDVTRRRRRGETLTGHRYGRCAACCARVRLNDDNTSRRHRPTMIGKISIQSDNEPCSGSNQLVAKLLEEDRAPATSSGRTE